MDHLTIFYYYSVIRLSTLYITYIFNVYKLETQVQASEKIKGNITIEKKFRVDDPEPI